MSDRLWFYLFQVSGGNKPNCSVWKIFVAVKFGENGKPMTYKCVHCAFTGGPNITQATSELPTVMASPSSRPYHQYAKEGLGIPNPGEAECTTPTSTGLPTCGTPLCPPWESTCRFFRPPRPMWSVFSVGRERLLGENLGKEVFVRSTARQLR